MKAVNPGAAQREQLLTLWKRSFGEFNGFWELFLRTGFAPERCLCLQEEGKILAALTWMDALYQGEKMAYLYAVATLPEQRGRGLCRRLLEDTHAHLTSLGYGAVLLVPGDAGLREFYRKSGYETCTAIAEFACAGYGDPLPLETIGPEQYARLRRQLLPENGAIQEGESLLFLAEQAQFYRGEGLLVAAWQEEGILNILELLGDSKKAARIVKTLGCWEGRIRMPGPEKPFAMGRVLRDGVTLPGYFGFAFD